MDSFNNNNNNVNGFVNANGQRQQYQPQYYPQQLYVPAKPPRKTVNLDRKDTVGFVLFAVLILLVSRIGVFCGFNIGFSISTVLLTTASYVYVFSKKRKISLFSNILFVLTLVLEISYAFNDDYTVKLLDTAMICFLHFAFISGASGSLTCTDGGYMSILEPVFSSFRTFAENVRLPYDSLKKSEKDGKKSVVFPVIIGVVVSLPLLAVIVSLLVSSDIAFSNLIEHIFSDLISAVGSIVLTFIAFPLFFIYIFAERKCGGEKRKVNNSRYGGVGAAALNTVLCVVNVAYVAYLVSQLAYVTKAFSFLLPENYTPAQFARSGFFEMAAIAFINFVIIAVISLIVKRKENMHLPVFTKSLLVFICLFTQFYIITAFVKMAQYISIFGLTRLRILTSVFMVMLFVIFFVILLRLFITKIYYGKAIIIICSLTLAALSFCDINTVISQYNCKRFTEQGKSLDVNQICDLGFSSYPELAALSENENQIIAKTAQYQLVWDAEMRLDMIFGEDSDGEEEPVIERIFGYNTVKNRARNVAEAFREKYPEITSEKAYEEYDKVNFHVNDVYGILNIYEDVEFEPLTCIKTNSRNSGSFNAVYNTYISSGLPFDEKQFADSNLEIINDVSRKDFLMRFDKLKSKFTEEEFKDFCDFDVNCISDADRYYYFDYSGCEMIFYDTETEVFHYFSFYG